MQRRQWLALGAVSAAVLAAGGGALAFLRPGLDGERLSLAGREVFRGVGKAMLAGSWPSQPDVFPAAMEDWLGRVDALVAGLPGHAQAELSQLLALLASGAGRAMLAGLHEPWQSAPVPAIQQALQSMRVSSVSLRQQAYQALHDIAGSAYFSDAQTWGLLGYPGPRAL
ncbi:MAG: hypothetical protein ACXWJM_03040 [Ramlibacter sp.]